MDSSEIIVKRSDLQQAIRKLQPAARGKKPPELVLQTEAGQLVLQVGEIKATIPGDGSLPGRAFISGLLVKILLKTLPLTPEIPITRADDRIAFGKNRIGCRWEEPQHQEITIPVQEDWLEALCLRKKYSMRKIEELGQKQQYPRALKERDRRISQAYETLAALGVSREELLNLVELAVRRLGRDNFSL